MFLCLLYISVALTAYIVVMIVVQRQISFSRAAYVASAAGLLVLLFLPLAVVVKQEYRIKKEHEEPAPLCRHRRRGHRLRLPTSAPS